MYILLAEDDPNIVKIAQMTLQKIGGHQVDVAIDGGKALEMALANKYDLLILDGMMPVHSGAEVCKAYKDQATDPAPVIFLSAKSAQEDIEEFLSLGQGYIQKPFVPTDLCQSIDDILAKVTQ